MHCVNCGYLLFNLTRPVCPECGRAFRVSDYRFEPDCVDFLCPSCLTPLDDGPPTPELAGRPCAHCGTPLSPDAITVRPRRPDAVGMLRDQYEDPALPRGGMPPVWPVWKRVMALDGDVFRDRARRSTGDAYWFAALCMFVAVVSAFVLSFGLFLLLLLLHGEWENMAQAVVMVPVGMIVGITAAMAGPLVVGGGLAVGAHVALTFLEPNCRPLSHTFRIACHAMAPVIIAGVPICGAFVAGPYAMAAFIVGIRAVHETSTVVAVVSALWLPALLMAGIVLL